MKLKPGKLYKITSASGLNAIPEKGLFLPKEEYENRFHIEKDKIFLFVEEIEVNKNTFSKILVDGNVLITYNGYLLANRIVEL